MSVCRNVDDLKKLIQNTKCIPVSEDFLDYVCGTPDKTLNLFSKFSIMILGMSSTICELAGMYNTVLSDVLESVGIEEDCLDDKIQEPLGKIILEIYRLQFLNPLYTNLQKVEEELQKERKKRDYQPCATQTLDNYIKDVYNIRFNLEEFELFLETKPFGTFDIDVEYK